MVGPVLAALGLTEAAVEELGLYHALLQLARDKSLRSSNLTVGFVVELSELVVTRKGRGRVEVPRDRIKVREFCHILIYVKGRHGEEVVTKDLEKNMWNSSRLKQLAHSEDRDIIWSSVKLLPGDEEDEMEEVKGKGEEEEREKEMDMKGGKEGKEEKAVAQMEVDKQNEAKESIVETVSAAGEVLYGIWMPRLECSGYLAMAGLVAGGQADVVELLGSWGKEEEALLTNGLVLEVVQEYRGPGTLLALAWVVARVLGVQPGQVGYDLHQRFKLYFARTAELVARGEAAMDGPWEFLAKLRQGGSLAAGREYLWAPPPRYTAMVGRLQTMVTGEARRCNMCEDLGDMRVCGGCMSVFVCSRRCLQQLWEAGHREECQAMREATLGDAVLPAPMRDRELSLFQARNRLAGLHSAAEARVVELREEVARLEEKRQLEVEERSDLLDRLEDISEELDVAKKSRAGLFSGIARRRSKEAAVEEEEVTAKEPTLSPASTLVEMKVVAMPELPHLKVYDGRVKETAEGERRGYGEGRFVKLQSRQSGRSTTLKGRQVQERAHTLMNLLRLVSCGGCVLEEGEAREEMMLVLLHAGKLYPTIFWQVVTKNPQLLRHVMTLTPEESCKFMGAANLKWAQRRLVVRMSLRHLGVPMLCSEAQQRRYEASLVTVVAPDKLEAKKMLLYRTATSEFPSLCGTVKVLELAPYFASLVQQLQVQQLQAGSIQNLQHPIYKGKIRLAIGGDKGGKVFRWTVEIASNPAHIFGMFEAADTYANLAAFLVGGSDWPAQLRELLEKGLEVTDPETGVTTTMEVELCIIGDYMFLCDLMGHQGSAATYPSLRDLTPSSHLRKAHLDGSPHTPTNPGCVFPRRTLEDFDRCYAANRVDRRNGGDVRKNGRHHGSVIAPRLLPILSLSDLSIASLHIMLKLAMLEVGYLRLMCRVQDGVATETELAKVVRELEELEEEEVDEMNEHTEEQLTAAQVQQRLRMAELEGEFTEQAAKVEELEGEEEYLAADIADKEQLRKRVELAAEGKVADLVKLAKKASKVRRMDRAFKKCSDTCLQTAYEGTVALRRCSGCEEQVHLTCQVVKEEEALVQEADLAPLTCRRCLGTDSFPQKLATINLMVKDLHSKVKVASHAVNEARIVLGSKEAAVEQYMGPKERRLEEILSVDLKVERCEFASQAYVGKHADIILSNYHKLSEVLQGMPVAKAGFLEFGAIVSRLLPLMKAKRQLSPDEVDQLEADCHKFGAVYPRVFRGSTIAPKLHELIFYMPEMARAKGTVGGLREEALEATHAQGNKLKRRLACVRKKEERLRMMLVAAELRAQQGDADFVKPLHSRKRKAKVAEVEEREADMVEEREADMVEVREEGMDEEREEGMEEERGEGEKGGRRPTRVGNGGEKD